MMCTVRRLRRPKNRSAKILFDKDSPFKQKVVKDKTKYVRKLKHPNKSRSNDVSSTLYFDA